MSTLSFQTMRLPAAKLGPDNPLPPLFNQRNPHSFQKILGVPPRIVGNFNYGFLPNNAPYTFQDSYTRKLVPFELKTAVLENEFLKAIFLIEFGGRLWSLFHKPTNRELLFVNPDFQLANLAIRNAWFCGGVEWNIGTIGHSPFTCSRLFTASLCRPDNTPVLRLYEWERFRQVPIQIDFCLPDKSQVLYVLVSIRNPKDHDVPIYWWSNIALPYIPGVRVIAPADSAFCLGCQEDAFIRIPIPEYDGTDFSYPRNINHAADLFYDIPHKSRHWITALDGNGEGFVQVSTGSLVGRKLWVWGSGQGGKNWQKFLSPRGEGYIEIQAGITQTQLEHLHMPGKSQLSWLEAYGLLETDPEIAHGSQWDKAVNHVESQLNSLISEDKMLSDFQLGKQVARSPFRQIIQLGSGWGALENRRRIAAGESPISNRAVDFLDESLDADQEPWISLLNNAKFPNQDPAQIPCGYQVSEYWKEMLWNSIDAGFSQNWVAWFHIGVMRHNEGDIYGAQTAWERSLNLSWSAWSSRCLGILAWKEARFEKAIELLLAAYRSQPGLTPLALECGRCMVKARKFDQFLEFYSDLPPHTQDLGRMRLLHAQSALHLGDLNTVSQFFEEGVIIEDLREGEQSLSDLWFEYRRKIAYQGSGICPTGVLSSQIPICCPLPAEFDFRMNS